MSVTLRVVLRTGASRLSTAFNIGATSIRLYRSLALWREWLLAAILVGSGVPLQRIRPALDALASEIGVIRRALHYQRLYTDGAEVLFDFAQHGARDERESAALQDVVCHSKWSASLH